MSDAAKMMQYDANKKSVVLAYVLWFFFGIFGVHRFYLGQTGTAVAILVLTVASFVLTIVAIGFIIFIIPFTWVFVDLFLIPGMARRYNSNLAASLSQ